MKWFWNCLCHETLKRKDSGVLAESAKRPRGTIASFCCVAALAKRQFEDWRATCSVEKHLILAVGWGGDFERLERNGFEIVCVTRH